MAQFDNEDEQDKLDKLNQQKNAAEGLQPIESSPIEPNPLSDEMENPELVSESLSVDEPIYAPKENLLKSYQSLKPKAIEQPIKSDVNESKDLDVLVKDNAEEDDSQALDDLIKENADESSINIPTEMKPISGMDSSRKAFDPSELLGLYQSLKPAQQKQQRDLGNITLLTGANQIAQGFARGHGGNIGEGEVGINALKAQAAAPVEAIKQQLDSAKEAMSTSKLAADYQETQKIADPNTSISKLARAKLFQLMSKSDPTLTSEAFNKEYGTASALQVEKLLSKGGIFNGGRNAKILKPEFIDSRTGEPAGVFDDGMGNVSMKYAGSNKTLTPEDVKHLVRPIAVTDSVTGLRGNFQAGTGMLIPGQNQPPKQQLVDDNGGAIPTSIKEIDLNKSNPKIYKDGFLKAREDMMHDKQIENARAMSSSTTNILTKLSALDPSNPKIDAGIKEALAAQAGRLSVGGGPLAESVIKEFGGTAGILDKIKRYASEKGPGVMTGADVDFFKNFALKMQKASQQDALDKSQVYVDRVKSLPFGVQIDDNNAKKLLNMDSLMQNTMFEKYNQMHPKTAPQGMITIKGPSGQTVQMDREKAKKYLSKPGYTEVK